MERSRRRQAMPWLVAAATVLSHVATYVLTWMNGSTVHGATAAWNGVGEVTSWAVLMGTATVLGVIVAVKRPENVLAWVFLLVGLFGVLTVLGDQYAGYALVTEPGALPGGLVARVLSFLTFVATWVLAGVMLPALFPTGQLVSRRWRSAVWLGVAGAAGWASIVLLPNAYRDDGLLGDIGRSNPLAIDGATAVVRPVSDFGILALFAGTFIAIVSMVVRTKRSRGVERQQIKVVAYTVAISTVVQLIIANTLELVSLPGSSAIWTVVSQVVILALPVSIGLALLRYRLYDIDRLINRTFVYGVLSAILVAGYAGAIVLLGTLVRPFSEGSDLAVALATLLVAVLFAPLRRAVQRFVDRRFYRTRYDAARTLEIFASRLRLETDVSSLVADVERIAQETMRPAFVTMWMPAGAEPRRMLS